MALASFFFFVHGPDAVANVPRCMAGCLLIHLGFELMREALVDSLDYFDRFEYLSVLIISVAMTVFGMTVGLGMGVLLSLSTFTLQMTQGSFPVRRARRATALKSSRFRPIAQRSFLNGALQDVLILQLQGTLFFGNAVILVQELERYLRQGNLSCVILDFTLVHYIDSSACDTIASTLRLLKGFSVDLAFVRGSKDGFSCKLHKKFMTKSIRAAAESSQMISSSDPIFLIANDLDETLIQVEDRLLAIDARRKTQESPRDLSQGSGLCEVPASFPNEIGDQSPESRFCALFPTGK